jgi:hypothetical protein
MSLFYVTMQAVANTTPAKLLKIFHPSTFESFGMVTHSFLYRANDLHLGGNAKPEWMIIYEIPAECKIQQRFTMESLTTNNASFKIHRQGLYSLHASR